jgi:superfamily II DNA or RNA helicase
MTIFPATVEHNVIDNQEVKMRDELARVLPNCKAANFALGYFFISGYREIHDQVSKVPKLRILMSGTTTHDTVDAILAGYRSFESAKNELDRKTILNQEALKASLAEGKRELKESLEVLEPEEKSEEAVKGLTGLIKKGALDVHLYTRGSLHAKCYIFHYNNPVPIPGSAIVGSSNLSVSGLVHNSELNLRTSHPADFAKLCKWFEDRWDESEPFKEEFLNILERSWAGNHAYLPRDIYYKALYERVRDRFEIDESMEGMLPHEFHELFEYQLLALKQSVQKVRKFNGVIIGDVVGLGKTYIGAALMRTLEQEGYRPLVICPPHLADMWRSFCGKFEVNARVLSHGMLRQDDFDLLGEIEYRDRDLVLIDESQNFRHEDTLQYDKLYRYMQAQNRGAILVTATPLSNSPIDVYNQIKLFHEGDETRIPISAPNLKVFFKEVEDGTANLSDLLTHIMIRRTRKFVLEHYGVKDPKGIRCLKLGDVYWYFPNRDLETVTYDVDKTYDGHYEELLELISRDHLTLARYGLFNYIKAKAKSKTQYASLARVGPQLLGLIRKILLKRMESSVEAFRKTVENLANVYALFLQAVDKGLIPAGKEQQQLLYDAAREGGATGVELDSLLDEVAKSSTQYWIGDFEVEELKADLRKDLETFERMHRTLLTLRTRDDDKLAQLENLVAKIEPSKKILIFTEYADTAMYLDACLRTKRPKAVVHGDIKEGRTLERIIRRFSPTYNQGLLAGDKEISLLISTDILAEGMNLQDARVVINYDLHWNPTRLIQRIGRVDRLAKEHMTVNVRNFLPARQIERQLNLERRLTERIKEIHRIIGEDNKILHPDEQLNEKAMYAIYQKLVLVEGDDGGIIGLDQIEQELRSLMKDDPEYWKSITEMPSGIRSTAPRQKGKEWAALVTCQLGIVQEHFVVEHDRKVTKIDWETAQRIVRVSIDESPAIPPADANELVASALSEFRKTQKQLDAKKGRGFSLSPEQRWATEQIARARDLAKTRQDRAELAKLFEAYQRPITLPAARKELRRLRRSEGDLKTALARWVERLREIYQTYDLGRRIGSTAPLPVTDVPRVLYARYVPKSLLEKVMDRGKTG